MRKNAPNCAYRSTKPAGYAQKRPQTPIPVQRPAGYAQKRPKLRIPVQTPCRVCAKTAQNAHTGPIPRQGMCKLISIRFKRRLYSINGILPQHGSENRARRETGREAGIARGREASTEARIARGGKRARRRESREIGKRARKRESREGGKRAQRYERAPE